MAIANIPVTETQTYTQHITDDKTVRGQLVTVSMDLTDIKGIRFTEEDIKKQMIHKLAEEMYKKGCVQFTKTISTHAFQTTIRAYAYVTPDDQIQLIRSKK